MTLVADQVVFIDVDRVQPNPDRSRRRIDRDGLDALALSIDRHGLLQPIVVRAIGQNRYELLAGERRLLAHRHLGRTGIAAVLATGLAAELSLVENLHRENLDALELAEAFARLADMRWSRDEMARLVGKSRTWVADLLLLNTLPDAIKAEYPTVRRAVSRSVLVEIARMRDAQSQMALWEEAKGGALTVRAARQKRRAAVPALPRALATVRRCVKQLERLEDVPAIVDEDDRSALLALRERIDALLASSPAGHERGKSSG